MAITNQALDVSLAKKTVEFGFGALATGVTQIIWQVAYPCTLNAAQVAAFGLSGAPNVALLNNRFIPGAGLTVMTVATGTSNVVVAFGTSGVGASGLNIGASFTQLLANDVLILQTGVANAAVTGLSGNIVITPIQDTTTYLGGLA